MTDGALEGFVVGALLGWVVVALAGPIHRPPVLTAVLMSVVYVALFAFAGHAIGRAVR